MKPFPKTERRVVTVTIDESGDMVFLNSPEHDVFLELGETITRRASHITPRAFWSKLAFNALRMLVSDNSKIAAWTRTWSGPWQIDMRAVGGPVVNGEWTTRQAAIDYEVAFLNDWFLRR